MSLDLTLLAKITALAQNADCVAIQGKIKSKQDQIGKLKQDITELEKDLENLVDPELKDFFKSKPSSPKKGTPKAKGDASKVDGAEILKLLKKKGTMPHKTIATELGYVSGDVLAFVKDSKDVTYKTNGPSSYNVTLAKK